LNGLIFLLLGLDWVTLVIGPGGSGQLFVAQVGFEF